MYSFISQSALSRDLTLIKSYHNSTILRHLSTEVHWKYNMHQHLQAQHPAWENNVLDGRELQEFREQITIYQDEGTRLGIPDNRRGLHIVDTDVRHANPLYFPSARNERGDSPSRRPRQETINTFLPYSQVPVPLIQLPIPLVNLHPHFVGWCLSLKYYFTICRHLRRSWFEFDGRVPCRAMPSKCRLSDITGSALSWVDLTSAIGGSRTSWFEISLR